MDCDPLQQACSLCARAPWEQAPFSSSGAPFACLELLQSLFSFPTSKPGSAQLPSTLSSAGLQVQTLPASLQQGFWQIWCMALIPGLKTLLHVYPSTSPTCGTPEPCTPHCWCTG